MPGRDWAEMTSTVSEPNVVIVAGAEAVQSGAAPALRDIAERCNIGVFNTWAAKGLFPWDHPAHLATLGLQAGDVALAGLAGFDDVILCGVGNDELDRTMLTAEGVPWREVLPVELAHQRLPVRMEPTPRPPLYARLAAVCGPMYADASLPLNPARAASDLAAALPEGGVVCADAGLVGFWIGRTLPTRTLASVQLPTRPTAGFAVTQALMARRTGRFSIAVLGRIDDVSRTVLDRAKDLVVEIWSCRGPAIASAERLHRISEAHAAGGVHVLELGVRVDEIEALVAVAGAPRWST